MHNHLQRELEQQEQEELIRNVSKTKYHERSWSIMFISVGYGGSVSVFEISAIGISDSAPQKGRRRDAKRKGFLIDFTRGHPMRSILFLKNHEVVLSSLKPETVVSRADKLLMKLGAFNKEASFYHDKFDLEKE